MVASGAEDTYSELDWDREEVNTGLLGDGITTWDTWKVDKGWFNNTLLTVDGLQDLFGKACYC